MKAQRHTVVEKFDAYDWGSSPELALARATRAAAEKARMLGAPGQARVTQGYDANYLVDFVKVEWVTPVLGSEQPPDIYGLAPGFRNTDILQPKVKISRRLGEIPR